MKRGVLGGDDSPSEADRETEPPRVSCRLGLLSPAQRRDL